MTISSCSGGVGPVVVGVVVGTVVVGGVVVSSPPHPATIRGIVSNAIIQIPINVVSSLFFKCVLLACILGRWNNIDI
jgi:hypothetical protein